MLLQKLRDYSERLDLPPTLYAEGPLRYIVELDEQGRLLSPTLTDLSDAASPRTRRGQRRLLPQVVRASNVKSFILADKAHYALGYVGTEGKPARVSQCHEAFLELLRRCVQVTEEPAVSAVLRFLESGPLDQLQLEDDFDPGGIITFRVGDVCPIDLASVQGFWASENDPGARDARVMQCLICGQNRPVLDRLQGKLRGVPGGQTSGTSIISANSEAFESYGLEASLIAPTCADCGERFTKAANDLLGGEKTRFAIGGAAFFLWTRVATDFDFFSLITRPEADEVRAQFESLFSGRRPAQSDETKFYATSLSGSGGRAVVRDWIDQTVGEVKDSLARWFTRQSIVDGLGAPPRPLGLYALASATVRDARDIVPITPRWLVRTALTGAPLPPALLSQAIGRNRAEQGVTRPRAALIKLVLSSQPGASSMEEAMVQLDPENDNAAYRCGRLLAVLERAQQLAIPNVNATIVDRYFGTASSAPESVFPRLVRGAQPHLAKVERDRGRGTYIALQRRIEDILAGLPVRRQGAIYRGFPTTLTLTDQGLFSLGYYHERAFNRAQAREAAQQRGATQTTNANGDLDDEAGN
jgi:CRISPR-associated protein Csd1